MAYSEKLSTRVYVVKWPASASSTGNSAGPNTTGMGSGISAGNVNALQGVSYLKGIVFFPAILNALNLN